MDAQRYSALIASYICHAFSTPAGNIANAMDAVDDEDPEMRAFGRKSMATNTAKLRALVEAFRYAFGVPGTEDAELGPDAVRTMVENLASSHSASCTVSVDAAAASMTMTRAFVTLALVGTGLLSKRTEGKAELTVRDGRATLRFEVTGPMARLREALAEALAGREPASGWSSKEAHALHLRRLIDQAGGSLSAETAEGRIAIVAELPAA